LEERRKKKIKWRINVSIYRKGEKEPARGNDGIG
jgi:hypothetical protein